MSAQESAAPKVKKGLWESLSPEDQKKAATVFLVSVGVTLLVTGRSGGKLLKRAKAAEGAAPAPAAAPRPAAPPPPPRAPRPAPTPAHVRPAPTAAAEPVQPPVSTRLPTPPPMSFLHPNSLAAPKPRRFLPSFVSSSSTTSSPGADTPFSILSSRPSPSSYFLPNPALTAQSTAFAAQLDKLDKLHEDGEGPPPAIEDGFNPAVYAAKAFGIASAITFSVFGAGIWGVMKWLEVDDLEGLALALQHRLPGVFDEHRPSVPSWAQPSSTSRRTDAPADPATEAEELSYWASVKETLDREAEEDRIRKVPPFTRTVVLGVLATTLPVILQLVSPYSVAFVPHRIAQNWELQRLVLPFLFGGGGIQLVFSLIMLYRSLKELEEGHFAMRLADMTWAFILICAGIIGLNTPLQNPWLYSAFQLAVVHLWAQVNSTNQVNLYGILTLPAPYFPFAMLGMDLLNGGPSVVLRSFTGMVAAHAYYFIAVIYPRQNNNQLPALLSSLLTPPQFLINTLGNGPAVPSSFSGAAGAAAGGGAASYRTAFGTAFRPAAGGRTLGGTPGAGAGAAGGAAAARAGGAQQQQAPSAAAGRGAPGTSARDERTATHRWGSGQRLGTD
ncbi:hypothetical protein JCM9279_000813 [Rhodotorula babjevae]